MASKPDVVWGAGINLMGLWGPYKMRYNKDLNGYHDRTGDFSVKGIGTRKESYGIYTFASTWRRETNLWMSGVRSSMIVIKEWCSQ